jgi:hypothetical protein
MDEQHYVIFVIDGEISDFLDPRTSVIRFTDQTRSEALDIARRALSEGYVVAAFLQADDYSEEEQ